MPELSKVYCLVNVSVAVAWLLQRSAASFTRAGDAATRLKLARTLLAVALAAPVLFAVLPSRYLPSVRAVMPQLLDGQGASKRVGTGHPDESLARKFHAAARGPRPEPAGSGWLQGFTSRRAAHGLFLSGLAIALGVLAWRWWSLGKLLGRAHLLHRLGRVRVAVSDEISVPFSARRGLGAWVVLSTEVVARPGDFRVALRHEIQHHRQGDTLWTLAVEAITALLYLNPFMFRWRVELAELQEFSCDAALVGRRKVASHDYGSCLVRVAEAALGNRSVLVGTTGMAAGLGDPKRLKSFLRRRVEMLPQHASGSRRGALVPVGTLISLLTVVFAYGTQEALREPRRPNPGQLETDPQIQEISQKAVESAVERHGADAGFAVVADPATGRVLAVANVDRRPGARPSKYWSLAQRLRPASVLKALVLSAAIENGATDPDDVYFCERGEWNWDGHKYSDWKAFGKLTAAEAVVHSSNICAIKIARKLGASSLTETMRRFGLGPDGSAETFPGALPGVFDPEIPGEPSLSLASFASGSALTVTPIEIVGAFGAVANGGRMMRPLASAAEKPQTAHRVISEETARRMRGVLARVLTEGTAAKQGSNLYRAGGKTGTAQDPAFPPSRSGKSGNVGSFAGFAPLDNPRLVIYVGIIRPSDGDGGAHGSGHAAPVFREIIDRTLPLLGVEPDRS